MIKLIAVEPKGERHLLLRFSDGAWGVCDFTPFVEVGTEMTEPLRDPVFFAKVYIELGALAWPNGFDLSAESLHRRMGEAGALRRGSAAA